jgi:membrane fusion protein, multidrug efflux system
VADGSSAAVSLDRTSTISPDRTRRRRSRLRLALLILGPALVIAGGLAAYLAGGRWVGTDDSYVRADMVAVSTDVSGVVAEVDVADNQHVAAGQTLFKLDDAPFRYAVDNAKAQLALARAGVEALKADWREKQQELHLGQINLDFAERERKRKAELIDQRIVPMAQMDQAQQAHDAAAQQIQTLQQQLAAIVANLGGNAELPTDQHPRVLAAQAQLDDAQRNLARTQVAAPREGIVTQVPSLQPGMYLRASTPGVSVVGADQPWIDANMKETDLTYVRPGQKVTIKVDSYPDGAWSGTVESISPASGAEFSLLPAQNTSGNWVKVGQRFTVRIAIDPAPGAPELRAGMSTEIEIDTGHRRTLDGLVAGLGLGKS